MVLQKKPEYSNVPVEDTVAPAPEVSDLSTRAPTISEEIDAELARPTTRETYLAKRARENSLIAPQRYNVTSKNEKALRVIHDFDGRHVAIPPGETKQVMLQPHVAQRLGKGDLEIDRA